MYSWKPLELVGPPLDIIYSTLWINNTSDTVFEVCIKVVGVL